ncbi:MAG TPA: host attachment protein [Acetobacteraceae bacterium]|jgi:protein required for attachment to host cells|nr:host attachment protein [Acetobacteraceae bacterium]
MMARPLTLRIAVADGEHARFVEPDTDNTLRTVGSLDSVSAHLRSRDIGADRPGRAFESGTSAHHAVGQRHDLHAMEKEKFARLVGEQINAAAARDEFDELLLVAPPRALQELQDALDAVARAKLVGTLEKDLVKTPDHELWPHVREWVSPARRPKV